MPLNFVADFREMGWLLSKLSGQRNLIADLMRQLAGLTNRQVWKPRFWRRFLSFAADLARAQDAEAAFLDRIEKIEASHLLLRKEQKLKRVKSSRSVPVHQSQRDEDNGREVFQGSDLLLKLFCLRLISADSAHSM